MKRQFVAEKSITRWAIPAFVKLGKMIPNSSVCLEHPGDACAAQVLLRCSTAGERAVAHYASVSHCQHNHYTGVTMADSHMIGGLAM